MLNILLVDDHPSVMEGTKLMLEKEGDMDVSIVMPGASVLEVIRMREYDVMLFDLNMPEISGLDLTKQVLAEKPDAKILIYTGFDIAPYFNTLIQLGAIGFVPKTAAQKDLVTAIRCAHRNESVIPVSLLRELRRDAVQVGAESGAKSESLSLKELDIVREIARGRSNKEIAEKLFISQRSLEYTLTQIFQKLNVKSRVEAVTKARQVGMLLDSDFVS
ncbi:response regulator transcription factor [Paenibacillus turpanensis]|uniref:response regulator transcription factor n=1 Tax=Paenibacillus turpanensis TaxID=2689078 RepID=UPI00140CEE06|nr:response regulator transcription factor [Paenibacillus turpanensis]